jgi:hypothetical protein
MKLLLASLVILSTTAGAVTAPVIKGNVNLDAITTNYAKRIGIKGLLPVSIEAEVTSAALKFNGFSERTTCLEYGEEEIPSHPETAPCLKYEKSWVPTVTMTTETKAVLNVGDKKVNSNIGSTFSVPESCIQNLKEEIVIGEVKPMDAPAVLKLAPACTTFSYTRIEDKAVKPSALKGRTMEAIVDLTLYLNYSSETVVELNRTEATKVNLSNVKSSVGSMWDFGGYNTRIFKYYDRVIFQ